MNIQIFLLPLLLALLFAGVPTDGTKHGKSKNKSKQIDDTIDSNNKTVFMESLSSDATPNNATKITEKSSYPKKVHSLKKRPTKTPTSYVTAAALSSSKNKRKKVTDVTAAFKDLPADDLEFIKELDKQFQLHGEKIKIKVENDNSTEGEKQTSKRTIDGELGYGAYSGHNGYVYERPKFMFYPYSQQNIAADAPGYYPPKTDVSIEPSYSYELQPQSYVQEPEHDLQQPAKVLDVPQHTHQQVSQQGQHGTYEEPVIVLRIPGPTKYASHLQTLLQQYLEIRAAQYLRILEEAEQQKQQQQQYPQPHLEEVQQQEQHALLYDQQAQQQPQQEQHTQLYEQQAQQQPQQEQHAQLYEQQAHQQPQQEQHTQLYIEQLQQQQHAIAPAQGYAAPTSELLPPAHEQHAAQQLPAEQELGYSPEVAFTHQVVPTPQSVAYPAIDDVYQGYKGKLNAQQAALHHQRLQQQQHLQQQQQVEYAPQQQEEVEHQQQLQHGQQYFVPAAQQPAAQQYYYAPEAQHGTPGNAHYQNVYILATASQGAYDQEDVHAAHGASLQQQPIYVQEDEQDLQQHHQPSQGQQQLQQEQHEQQLAAAALSENNPRQTHTKVVYTHNGEKGAADYSGGYVLPSIRPYERHRGISAAAYHQQQQLQAQLQHEKLQHQQQQFAYETPLTHAASEHEQLGAITSRPFNYHAHRTKTARRGNRKRGAAAPTTTVAPTAAQVDEHLEQIREFVRDKFGAQMSKSVEFKTAPLVQS